MKGDFSKWVDRKEIKKNNFNGVLHQQGKVLLDSDWNVQTSINNNWQDTAGRDIIGAGIAAVPAEEPDGFKVTAASVVKNEVKITVKPGRAWVDGLLVYLDEDNDVHIATYLEPPIQDPTASVSTIAPGVRDAVILEIWREAVNGFQIPETLIEPALGGPDTTERVQTAMAFRLLRLAKGDNCNNIGDKLKDDFSKKGKLKVSLQPTVVINGDCPVTRGGGYTGFEHNLYRIEIAKVDSGVPMFKLSQFNGGLVGRGIFDAAKNKATITANLQPIVTSDTKGFYLETVEYDSDLGYWKVTYGAKVTLNNENELELPATPMFGSIPSDTTSTGEENHVFFRLWNDIRFISDFPKAISPAEPVELRDGIRLEFEQPAAANYIPGDYWTFSVRAGEIKNDQVLIDWKTPAGIHYHRAPLAIMNWNSKRDISFEKGDIEDCRDVFPPLTNQTICCSFKVGDGRSSHGDFDSIEEALKHLPGYGGEICLLPGLHETNLLIEGRQNIKIRGCDKRTKIIPRKSGRDAPIFHVVDSKGITLENMDMVTLNGTAIVLEGTKSGSLEEIEVRSNRILACVEAISVKQGSDINIHHNRIRMLDKEKSGVAIFVMAEDSVIERNNIGVIPAESIPPVTPPGDGTPPDPTDPCTDPELVYKNTFYLVAYVDQIWTIPIIFPRKNSFGALGGIQIIAGSERIKVQENEINGGAGNGITLGGTLEPVPSDSDEHVIDNKGGYIFCNVIYKGGVLAGISFLFKGKNIEMTSITDQDGSFLVKTGPGKYNVSVMAPGYKFKNITVVGQTRYGPLYQIDLVDKDTDDVPVFIYDVQIDRNEISNMSLSGIGIPQEIPQQSISSTTSSGRFGLSAIVLPNFLNPVVNISIHSNHIFNCLQSPFDGNRMVGALQIGFGGISLGICGNLSVNGNRIENNGISYNYPVCGIFIGYGEHVDISHNYIVNNGPLNPNIDIETKRGIRGGVIMTVSSFPIIEPSAAFFNLGLNAARVHNNVVDQPAGQALRIISSGPVSVLNNQFNSELTGTEISGSLPFDQIAGAALIYGIVSISDRGNKMNSVSTGVFSKRASSQPTLKGNVLFNNNQVRVGSANESITSLVIFAEDIGFEGNQSDNLSVGTLMYNTFLFANTLRASNNRFKEPGVKPEDTRVLSLHTQSVFMNNTTNNQGDHCIMAISSSQLVNSGNLILSGAEQCRRLERSLQEYIKNNQQLMGAFL
ncbi:MAG: DUF6519 domain-containing protein [Acidobacteriota bacterium]